MLTNGQMRMLPKQWSTLALYWRTVGVSEVARFSPVAVSAVAPNYKIVSCS